MTTEVNMEVLTQYLEKFGWSRYRAEDEESEEEGIIYTGWRSSPETSGFNLSIDPMVEKGCLSFRVHRVVQAPRDSTDPDRLAGLLTVLAWVNFRIILGKFGYDHRDGEVRFSIDVPIDDNDFNYAQFEHSLGVTINTVETWEPRFRALLDGKTELEDLLAE